MTEFDFFFNKVERWTKDLFNLWGNINICPCLNYLELPCHSPGELFSIGTLKILGDIQEPCNDMAYRLVHTRDTLEAWDYGASLVWIHPNQVWASTMKEVVSTLSAFISSGPDWPYAHVQLYKGSNHTPLPKGEASGHPTSGKGRGEILWADQPTQSLPAPFCWAMSSLSCRFKWEWQTSYNHSTRTTEQWC